MTEINIEIGPNLKEAIIRLIESHRGRSTSPGEAIQEAFCLNLTDVLIFKIEDDSAAALLKDGITLKVE